MQIGEKRNEGSWWLALLLGLPEVLSGTLLDRRLYTVSGHLAVFKDFPI